MFKESGVNNEFKWQKVRNIKYKFVAEKLYTFIFKHLDKLRIDVIIWDTEDKNFKQSNGTNIGKMYYHLVQNTLSKYWGNDSIWLWHPDKQSSMDWRTLGKCLVAKKHGLSTDLFGINQNNFMKLRLEMIKVVDSRKEIFVQVADYFAGLGAYSYGHFQRHRTWEGDQTQQAFFFKDIETINSWSNSEKIRFPLISLFDEFCKERSLGISLHTTNGLRTHNPSKASINFWLYKTRHSFQE